MSERVGLEGVLDLSQFTGNLNIYVQGVAKMKSETVEASAGITRAGGGLNIFREIGVGALRAVGEAAVEWMGRAGLAVAKFTRESIAGALEDEQTLTHLNQVIKSTGGVAGLTAAEAQALAQQFHILAGGSDDLVLSLIRIGLQAGTIAESEMPAFIQASLDLGAVMKNNAAAAELLAFAQEQPTQSLRRFRQANIVFSDSLVAQIKALEDAGKAGEAYDLILARVTQATAGAAQANLDTITGKMGLFRTIVGEAGEKIVGSFIPAAHALFDSTLGPAIPIIDSLSSSLADMITQLLSGDVAAGLDGVRASVDSTLSDTADSARQWGENITISLANGIVDGVGAVIDSLISVGNIIAGFLMPGSPPKLLPDLPEWGAAAMSEWINGFTSADFGAFKDLSSQFESFLRGMSKDIVPETGLVPLILGGRDAVAEAIAQVKQVGAVTDDIVASVTAAFGPAGGALTGYTRALLESEVANQAVADAQAALNSVVAEYDALLKGVDDDLSAIDNAQQDLADEQRKTFLNAILLDPNASASKKANARLELEKIAANKRKRLLLDEKKLAVDNAQSVLDSAKEKQVAADMELARQKALLSIQMEQNKLLKEQADLLEKLAKAAGGGGGGAAKPAGGATPKKGFGGGLGLLDDVGLTKGTGHENKQLTEWEKIINGLKDKFAELQESWASVWSAITATLAPATAAWSAAMAAISLAFDNLIAAIVGTSPTAQAALGILSAFFVETLGRNIPLVITNLATTISMTLNGLADFWRTWGDEIIMATTFAFETVIAGVGGALSIVTSVIAAFTVMGSGIWKAFALLLQGDWQGALNVVVEATNTGLDLITTGIVAFFDSALSIVGTNLGEFIASWEGTLELLKILVLETFTNVALSIKTGISDAIAGARELLGDFLTLGTDIIDGIIQGITDAAGRLVQAARDAIQGALDAASAALGNPHSPSPVTRKLHGRPFSEGMAAGALDGLKLLRQASLTAATALLAPASGMINNTSSTSSTTNYNLSEHYNTGPKDSVRSFMSMKARARG